MRCYLEGYRFKVETDLICLVEIPEPTSRLTKLMMLKKIRNSEQKNRLGVSPCLFCYRYCSQKTSPLKEFDISCTSLRENLITTIKIPSKPMDATAMNCKSVAYKFDFAMT